MSIASELQDKINAKAAIKAAIEAKGVTVGDIKLNQYAAKIDEIQQGGTGTGDWIRPADWLPIDNLVAAGEQKTVGLYAVYPNVNNKGMTNTVAFVATGNYTVDWGDGVVENFNSNVVAQHIYDYNSLSASTECTRGYRQAIITITPQSGQNITQILFGRKHSSVVFGRISSQWLDLVIGGTAISYFRMQDLNVFPNLLEKVKAIQSNVSCTNMSYMFQNCYSLQSLDLSSFNTSSVTNMSYMFQNCYSLQSLDLSSFNTSAVTNMISMFYNCSSLQSLDLSSFNTSLVTNMIYMFYNCSSLQSLDLSSFNTSSVTNMIYMFYNCSSLQSLDLSSFNTSLVTNMGYMFYNCYSLQSLDISSFNTSAVTNMIGMFQNCFSLQSLDLSSFNTSAVTNMIGMFQNCPSLQSLDISSFNTSSVTNMSCMFYNCPSLQSLDLSSFNTSLVTNMSYMFQNCYSLQSIDLSATLLNAVSSGANFASFTNGTISLIKCRLPQVKWSFTVAGNPLSATELNLLFNDLFNLTALATQTITITGCTGAATCDKTIATNKNWTVIG